MVAERAQRDRIVQEGEAFCSRDLPAMLVELRRVQRQWVAFRGKLEALDTRLGQAAFADWACLYVMAPGGVRDGFIANATKRFGLAESEPGLSLRPPSLLDSAAWRGPCAYCSLCSAYFQSRRPPAPSRRACLEPWRTT